MTVKLTPPPLVPPDLPGLTGLRGVLALAVLIYHLGWLPGGWLAVDGFFLLSGLVLTHVYHLPAVAIRHRNMDVRFGLRCGPSEFFWHRFARLAPTCVASTLIVVAAGWVTGEHFAPGDIAATLAVLPLIGHRSQINGAMWSLAVEGVLYAMFPLLLLALPKSHTVRRAAVMVCALGAAVIAWRSFAGHGFVAGPLAVLRGLFPFVAGMLIYGGWNEQEQGRGRPRMGRMARAIRQAAGRRVGAGHEGTARGIGSYAKTDTLCCAASRNIENVPRLAPKAEVVGHSCISGIPQEITDEPCQASCMARNWLPTMARRSVAFLDSRPIRWLGEISLPLYLCQIVPLRLLGHSLWVIPAALMLAATVHHTIELPGRRWLRKSRMPTIRGKRANVRL